LGTVELTQDFSAAVLVFRQEKTLSIRNQQPQFDVN